MSKYDVCPYFWGLAQEGKKYYIKCGDNSRISLEFQTEEFAQKKINEQCKGEGMTECRPFLFRQLKEMGAEPDSSWNLGELKAEYDKRTSKMCESCTNSDEDCRPGSEDACVAYKNDAAKDEKEKRSKVCPYLDEQMSCGGKRTPFCENGLYYACYTARCIEAEAETEHADNTALETPAANSVREFDYSTVDDETATFLQEKAARITEIRIRSVVAIGKEFKEARDRLSSHNKYEGVFGKWVESLNISRQTVQNYIQAYEYVVKNFDNIELAENIQPSLLFAASKPSSPKELADKVASGGITTLKEYRELEAKLREAEERAKKAELALKQSQDYHKSKNDLHKNEVDALNKKIAELRSQLENKPEVVEVVKVPEEVELELKQLNEQLLLYKAEAEAAKQDSKKLEEIRSTIKHLESHRDKLNEYIHLFDDLADLRAGVLTMLKNDLAPMRYTNLLKAARDNKQLADTINEILEVVRQWLSDMEREWAGSNYIEAKVVNAEDE